ncbi:hypothetical protein ERJ75_000717400 [Trypanosoma vivax]|uniref:Uncharacterized protein n=1 Tax=Trypanosoma vivax (strain Y486) TaxID=1055687 RepID=G0TWP7_TRYVY|nr:hypothetical protein ERJ75_000717400 [Trypanosoma vivax]CCC48385.1 conserved hypothetical protein [Trypanosoma vivax Y486]
MSGLWSFREDMTPSACLGDATRKVLPAALDDYVMFNDAVRDGSAASTDLTVTIDGFNDVSVAVDEVQRDWLHRTLGEAGKGLYRLNSQDTGTAQECAGASMGGVPIAYEDNLLDATEMMFVKSLLRSHGSKVETKTPSLCDRRGVLALSEPAPFKGPSSAVRATKRRVKKIENKTVELTPTGGGCSWGRTTKSSVSSQPRASVTRAVSDGKRPIEELQDAHNSSHLNRRFYVCGGRPTFRFAGAHAPTHTSAQASCKTTITHMAAGCMASRYDALPIDMRVNLMSLEALLRNDSATVYQGEFDKIAYQWHCSRLKSVAWRRWRSCHRWNSERINTRRAVHSTDGFSDQRVQVEESMVALTASSTVEGQATLHNIYEMHLLRWCFVVWFAHVESARGRCVF